MPSTIGRADAGVDLYLCAQTAAAFGVTMENKAAPVQMALSAMTMLALLQADGDVKVH